MYETGIRPAIDQYLLKLAEQKRDYGNYWSASSAGYCMRKNIFDRLGCPPVKEDPRKQRVFESGHIFHSWMQDITKNAGLSIAQEVELQDEDLMIKGHIDDLILMDDKLILYDYKTQNSRAFSYKRPNMSHFHRMQLGTYMYMLRKGSWTKDGNFSKKDLELSFLPISKLEEARIMKISKDDLRMSEEQLLYSPELEKEVVGYWRTLNGYWAKRELPRCTCADREGGFMAKEAYNPYYYNSEPCSIEYLNKCKKEGKLREQATK